MIEKLAENYINADINEIIKKVNELVDRTNNPQYIARPKTAPKKRNDKSS